MTQHQPNTLRRAIALSLLALGIGCDAAPLHQPAVQLEAPLEGAAQAGHGDAADDEGVNPTGTSAEPSIDENLSFEEQVERLMAESEPFREAVATIRLIDTMPEGFVPAIVETSAKGMTCNKPQDAPELDRAPTEAVTGDPLREIPLLARLQTLKSGDLEPTARDEAIAPTEP